MQILVVFCEGPHDIHFAGRSLVRHAGHEVFNGPASQLPTPFGWVPQDGLVSQLGLVVAQARRIDPLQLDLDRVNFGTKPLFELATHSQGRESWCLFVNMGGDAAVDEVVRLIERIRGAQVRRGLQTKQVGFAFVFDADFQEAGRGLEWRKNLFVEKYSKIFEELESISPGRWMVAASEPVGLWVHHLVGEGTLEDHAGPIFQAAADWSTSFEGALKYIEAHAREEAAVLKRRDKRWKAAITIAGQLRSSANAKGSLAGSGLNVMVQRGLAEDAFDAEVCKQLATFLTETPWAHA